MGGIKRRPSALLAEIEKKDQVNIKDSELSMLDMTLFVNFQTEDTKLGFEPRAGKKIGTILCFNNKKRHL